LTGRRRSYDQLDADAFFPIASADLVRAAKPRPAIPSSIIVQVDGSGVPIGSPKSKALTRPRTQLAWIRTFSPARHAPDT